MACGSTLVARRASGGRCGEGPSAVELALEAPPEDAFEPLGDADQAVEVDPGVDSLALEEVHEILGGDVAGCLRREGAPPEPSDRGVDERRSGLERREGVRVAGVPRVMEVAD